MQLALLPALTGLAVQLMLPPAVGDAVPLTVNCLGAVHVGLAPPPAPVQAHE